jgi:hypothetical protein
MGFADCGRRGGIDGWQLSSRIRGLVVDRAGLAAGE